MAEHVENIRARSHQYALRTIKLYQSLQGTKDGAGWILGRQYLRGATSIGANVEEAQSGESRADFIHKYAIAQKEARESVYWLGLLAESGIIPLQRLRPLMKETEELYAMITGIILSAKARTKGQSGKERANREG
jgi:four helix bundle protein